MEFVNPGFLYGLSAIAIPVIIHLFNFRRYKKVYFSNVKLLKELQLKTRRKSRLKHLILLFLRILAIICIVMAFAQPYFPLSDNMINTEESSAVSIYVDNSFSMAGESVNNTLIEEAKNRALEIADAFKPSDRYQLATNNLEGRHMRFVSREDFTDLLDDITVTPVYQNISTITQHLQEQLKKEKSVNKVIYLISDFRKNSADIQNIAVDSNIFVYLISLIPIDDHNLHIDSCWLDAPVLLPGQNARLSLKISNSSNRDYEKIPLTLNVNNRQLALASVDLKGGESSRATLNFTAHEPGLYQGHVDIPDYPVTFDDRLFLTYRIHNEIPVLSILQEGENDFINALFIADSAFRLSNVKLSQLDYSTLRNFGLIILNHLESIPSGLSDELDRFVSSGGSLLIIPPVNLPDFESYNSLLTDLKQNIILEEDTTRIRVDFMNLQHPLFENVFEEIPDNVDLPVADRHYSFTSNTRINQSPILGLQNGDVFLSASDVGEGKVYVSSVAFDASAGNFTRHALFVPVLYKIALMTNGRGQLYHIIGENESIEIGNMDLESEEVLKIKDPGSDFETIPEIRTINYSLFINTHDQISNAGNYLLMKGEQIFDGISFNYDRMESDLRYFSPEEIQKIVDDTGYPNIRVLELSNQPVSQAVSVINNGVRLWKLFIILALLFLAAEIVIIRIWK